MWQNGDVFVLLVELLSNGACCRFSHGVGLLVIGDLLKHLTPSGADLVLFKQHSDGNQAHIQSLSSTPRHCGQYGDACGLACSELPK